MQGIYQIINMKNFDRYIGSSINCEKRKRRHFNELKNNKHKNAHLQNAYNFYGADSFEFCVVEEIRDKTDLIKVEQFYIDLINPEYNINKIANSSLGVKRRQETREKIRKANKGLKHPEWRNKIKSKAQGGKNHWTQSKKFSDASKLNMSNAQKLLYKNGYISHRKGKTIPSEVIKTHIDKISIAIIQYDLDGNFIKEWKSAKEAEKFGFNAGSISNCLHGKLKTYKKCLWKKKDLS